MQVILILALIIFILKQIYCEKIIYKKIACLLRFNPLKCFDIAVNLTAVFNLKSKDVQGIPKMFKSAMETVFTKPF